MLGHANKNYTHKSLIIFHYFINKSIANSISPPDKILIIKIYWI